MTERRGTGERESWKGTTCRDCAGDSNRGIQSVGLVVMVVSHIVVFHELSHPRGVYGLKRHSEAHEWRCRTNSMFL